MYVGALFAAPFILSGVNHINVNASNVNHDMTVMLGASHENYQQRADQRPQARRDFRNSNYRHDSHYWVKRINRVAYTRRPYSHPSINWNARDLGGYYVGHGYYTKKDKVFRGGDLHTISRKGIRRMHQLHINKVIDLRSSNYSEGKDKRIKGVTFHRYAVNTARQKAYLRPLKARYGGEIYKYGTSLVLWKQARWAYKQVFKQLLYHNQHGATYFHCIKGRDRTGIMAALYLSALGVNKHQIYNDFLTTDYYRYTYTYRNQVAELNRFYRAIHHHYGSMSHYLRKGVGLSNHQIHRLRRLYLVRK